MILGIDISTTIAGICILDNDSNIVDLTALKIHHFENLKDKAYFVINYLKNKNIKFEKIIIEEPLLGFSNGRTSQQTIVKLIRFNAIFSYIIEEEFKLKPELKAATTMRKYVFGKCREKGTPAKEFVKREMEKMIDLSKWLRFNPRTGKEMPFNADMRDSWVCAKNGL